MDLVQYLRIVRKYGRSLVALAVLGAASGAVLAYLTPPSYTAKAAVFISVKSSGTAGELAQGSTYVENQVRSYALVATAPVVLQPVIDRLELDATVGDLARQVSASAPEGTAIIEISVEQGPPEQSARIANAVAQETVAAVAQLSQTDRDDAAAVRATVITPATVPVEPTSPRASRNVLFGAMLGLLVGLLQAMLRAAFDARVVTEADVVAGCGVAVIGAVPADPDAASSPIAPFDGSSSPRAEAYRRLRTNLGHAVGGQHAGSVLVTSAAPGEGKSLTALNLATAIAMAGQSVLLVDADLRRPTLARYLTTAPGPGLTTVVGGQGSLVDLARPIGDGRLHLLTTGPLPANPSELLHGSAFASLLAEATARYDVVVVDSPPLLPVTDAAVLATLCDGVVLVVGSGQLTKPQLQRGLDALSAVGATVFGVALNRVPRSAQAAGGNYAYYRYRRQVEGLRVGSA